ncbi:polyprenyl synthetase family protein [Bifidobacterium amazonense]|uniref:Polyprenyl synthetase family protein n=1 Tax=Bifidobacterium amazonense TaxID=2809027 RepID=A0ABS9VWR6_9BIFI|nr:polyprenyl synthetase family protein [Bifidobacterium amazonense]MCH9276527.1 polyprenyl synthetase family protein [Bifidobacterium amazonense]
MSVAAEMTSIEPRIAELIRHSMALRETDGVAGPCAGVLRDVVSQALTSSEGGKRLRARLALAAFDQATHGDASDERRAGMLDLACAIEVFQTAALVHDDIIDESDLRRGKPSAHRALSQATHSDAIGRGLGIMLGDLLATASVDIADDASRRLASSDGIVAAFLNMHKEVEVGQVLDLAVELAPLDDPAALADASLNVFRWKTASYTTIAPIELALLAAGHDPDESRRTALAIGRPLGLAFQLADDLLDVVGSSSRTGKPVGGDIREGKRTVLLADALDMASPAERDELVDAFSAPSRGDDRVGRVIALFESTGAVARSRERIAALWDESRAAIAGTCAGDAPEDRAFAEACARFVPLA